MRKCSFIGERSFTATSTPNNAVRLQIASEIRRITYEIIYAS